MTDMENSETKLTALQFEILNGMADDYEDVEQLYLSANRDFSDEKQANVQFPQMVVDVRFPLRDIVNEVVNMLREGYIFAKSSNDERFAPLCPPNLALLHLIGLARRIRDCNLGRTIRRTKPQHSKQANAKVQSCTH